jgi:hypothetical protein
LESPYKVEHEFTNVMALEGLTAGFAIVSAREKWLPLAGHLSPGVFDEPDHVGERMIQRDGNCEGMQRSKPSYGPGDVGRPVARLLPPVAFHPDRGHGALREGMDKRVAECTENEIDTLGPETIIALPKDQLTDTRREGHVHAIALAKSILVQGYAPEA